MTDIHQGDTWTASDTTIAALGTHPAWVRFQSAHVVGGTVQGPTGYRRMVWADQDLHRQEDMLRILPPTGYTDPEDIGTPWMAVVSDRNGNTLMADGVRGVSCIGTPEVRLTDNGPSRAVLELAPGPYTWSDGHTAQIVRGCELAVWFRDADSGALVPVFRGAVRQVDRGLTVTVTAYDRVMDLAEYSDQYQPHNTHAPETSFQRSIVGTNYNYTFTAPIGQLVNARAVHRITADPLEEMDQYGTYGDGQTAIIPMINTGGYTPVSGSPITHVTARVWVYRNGQVGYPIVDATFYLLLATGTTFQVMATATASISETGTLPVFRNIGTDVNWTLPSGSVYIGVYIHGRNSSIGQAPNVSIASSTTTYLSTGPRYLYNGAPSGTFTASPSTASSQPEVALTYCALAGTVDTGAITVSGKVATVPESSIPGDISENYISTDERGVALRLDYYTLNSIKVADIVRTLIGNAGMVPDLPDTADLGNLSYYTTSTYDYLTCLHELIKGKDYGLKDTLTAGEGGRIVVRPRHTIDETASVSYTTDPDGAGQRVIVSHDLTSHWMAERATQAIIAESTTTSGIPIALETDDRLFDNSLASAIGSPMRGVSADNSAGTHALLAMSAGGGIRQLHTNVVEGTVTLAGYRLAVWDMTSAGEGGNPIVLDVPEAGVLTTAIPTEIVIGNGVTRVTLDNIRTQDRSEVAKSMGNTADGVSARARALPDVVYLFATHLTYEIQEGDLPSHFYRGGVSLIRATGGVALTAQADADFIREVDEDPAGYHHVAVYFPAPESGAIAANDPAASIGTEYPFSQWDNIVPLDNPKNVLAGQSVHLDIRIPKRATPTS